MIARLLLAIQVLLLQGVTVQNAGISGSVVDAGAPFLQPLLDSRVELAIGSRPPAVIRTDENGKFTFSNLGPGKYRLTVTRDGFIRRSTTVSIASGQQRNDVLIALDAAPSLFGHIRDSNNVPVANVLVEAIKAVFGPRGDRSILSVESALTDDRGEYHLYWLDPGDYYIRASTLQLSPGMGIPGNPPPELPGPLYATTYHPGTRDPKDAATIHVRVGSNLSGFDFRLQPVSPIFVRGNISIEATGVPVGTLITISPAGETASSQQYQTKSKDNLPTVPQKERGEYSVGGMPPGTYVISAQFTSDGRLLSLHRKVALKISELALILHLSPGVAVSGQIAAESGPAVDLGSTRMVLESVDPDLPSPPIAPVSANGQFSVERVEPGDYVFRLLDLPGDAYVKAARSGEVDILARPARIDWARPEPIRVVLGTDGGRLDGVVLDRMDRPFSDAQVVLVPDAARRNVPGQFSIATSSDDGRFTLRGIPPGEYKLFAWQSLEPNAYLNANFMEGYESLGMSLSIATGSAGTTSVRLIPLD